MEIPFPDSIRSVARLIVFELDSSGIIESSFGAGYSALQKDEGESVGMSIFDLYGYDTDIARHIRRGLRGESFTAIAIVEGQSGPAVFETTYLPRPGAPGLLGVAFDVTDRWEAERRLKQSLHRAGELAAQLGSEREAERRRVARYVHDVLGQDLTAIRLDIQWLTRRLVNVGSVDDAVIDRLRALDENALNTIRAVRRIAQSLRPEAMDAFGFSEAVGALARLHKEKTGATCTLEVTPGIDEDLDDARAVAVYRIVQEALTNVCRHAGASEVAIRVTLEGAAVAVLVRDNGCGITEAAPSSLGLTGMSERAETWGGVLSVGVSPDGGTQVEARIPRAISLTPYR